MGAATNVAASCSYCSNGCAGPKACRSKPTARGDRPETITGNVAGMNAVVPGRPAASTCWACASVSATTTREPARAPTWNGWDATKVRGHGIPAAPCGRSSTGNRSEEHTSELQSRLHLVCRLLLEKQKKNIRTTNVHINT